MGTVFRPRPAPQGLSFRDIVTTASRSLPRNIRLVDYIVRSTMARQNDVFLLLIADVKSAATFERVAREGVAPRRKTAALIGKLGPNRTRGAPRCRVATPRQGRGSHAEYRRV